MKVGKYLLILGGAAVGYALIVALWRPSGDSAGEATAVSDMGLGVREATRQVTAEFARSLETPMGQAIERRLAESSSSPAAPYVPAVHPALSRLASDVGPRGATVVTLLSVFLVQDVPLPDGEDGERAKLTWENMHAAKALLSGAKPEEVGETIRKAMEFTSSEPPAVQAAMLQTVRELGTVPELKAQSASIFLEEIDRQGNGPPSQQKKDRADQLIRFYLEIAHEGSDRQQLRDHLTPLKSLMMSSDSADSEPVSP